MAGPGLPVTIDTTYADSGTDATVKLHQQHHDTLHGIADKFDQVTPLDGQAYVWSAALSMWTPATALLANVIIRWTGAAWPSRPVGAPFGVMWLSSNDPAATAPSVGLLTGDLWGTHPDAP